MCISGCVNTDVEPVHTYSIARYIEFNLMNLLILFSSG